MYSLKNHYHSLGRTDKEEFKRKVLELMDISKEVFYAWLMRDNIPKRMRDKFAKEILEKDSL